MKFPHFRQFHPIRSSELRNVDPDTAASDLAVRDAPDMDRVDLAVLIVGVLTVGVLAVGVFAGDVFHGEGLADGVVGDEYEYPAPGTGPTLLKDDQSSIELWHGFSVPHASHAR